MNLPTLFLSFFVLTTVSFKASASPKKRPKDLSGEVSLNTERFVSVEGEQNFDGEILLKYRHKFNKNIGLILAPHVDFNKFENSKNRSYLLRTENSGLYINHNNFSLTAGLLSHSFGLSKLFSPLNFVDTASYWSPLSPQKISSPTLRFMYKTKKVRLFGSFMPKRFENIYPGNETPWIPTRLPGSIESEGDTFFLPDRANFNIGDKSVIDDALSNNFVGGLRLNLKPFLTQFIYYKGVDTDPTVDLNLNLTSIDVTPGARQFQIDNPIGVTPLYQTVERFGVSVRYTLPFKWRLLYEGNLSRGDENQRQGYRESQTHTAALEWGVPIGKTLLLGVLQAYTSKNSSESSLGFVSPFREAYLVGANWSYKKLDLSGGYFTSKSLKIELYSAKIGYKLKNNFQLNLSGAFLEGELVEFISGILDLDTISVGLKYKF